MVGSDKKQVAVVSQKCQQQKEIKMIKYILTIAVLVTGAAFARTDQEPLRINKEIRHELVTLPFLDVFDNLEYRVDGNSVTLSGQVTRPTLKTAAERVVKGIEGVDTVNNYIEVLPLSPNDSRLRLALYRAIYGYPALKRYELPVLKPIRIIVKNGNVTLAGVVASQSDKNIANIRANGVHGIFSVTNNLQVEK
jgi:osmotically-inducible protein OsmY